MDQSTKKKGLLGRLAPKWSRASRKAKGGRASQKQKGAKGAKKEAKLRAAVAKTNGVVAQLSSPQRQRPLKNNDDYVEVGDGDQPAQLLKLMSREC